MDCVVKKAKAKGREEKKMGSGERALPVIWRDRWAMATVTGAGAASGCLMSMWWSTSTRTGTGW